MINSIHDKNFKAGNGSHAFEFRYFSNDPSANGETDFKGASAVFTTEERISFLQAYADYGKKFWNDHALDTQVVSLEEARKRTNSIKPQPKSFIRDRIELDEWKSIGYHAGLEEVRKAELAVWEAYSGFEVSTKGMTFVMPGRVVHTFPEQSWRFFLEWCLPKDGNWFGSCFSLGGCAAVGFDEGGRFFYCSGGVTKTLETEIVGDCRIRVEVDIEYKRYNVELNGTRLVDFVSFKESRTESFSEWTIEGGEGLCITDIWGVGYRQIDALEKIVPTDRDKSASRIQLQDESNDGRTPFAIKTFVDENFRRPHSMVDWTLREYNDQDWENVQLPACLGGERHAGKDLFLRKTVVIDTLPEEAWLDVEALSPGGRLFINGEQVFETGDSQRMVSGPERLDVRPYLTEGRNTMALQVFSRDIPYGENMGHTAQDRHTGSFAGRFFLNLVPRLHIQDVFSWTQDLTGDGADQCINVSVAGGDRHTHSLRAELSPWFPNEGHVCSMCEWNGKGGRTERTLHVDTPELWTPDRPFLYQLRIVLLDENHQEIDDFVTTTGIRTVSQDGGTFRINGEPEFLRAPLLFGMRAPLDKIAEWDACSPAECMVQEMMMVKKMNGNGFRMSVHDSTTGGTNDPRYAELADQMGIMLVWQTSAWLREGPSLRIDTNILSQCVEQVRNHPSIVIWQPSNHPSIKSWEETIAFYHKVYDAIFPLDESRLISPSADSRSLHAYSDDGRRDRNGQPVFDCDPVWTAPMITRGSMDYPTGYGTEWTTLRQWPHCDVDRYPIWMPPEKYVADFLASQERAYFNFEHEESSGQPNWELLRGKPYYRVFSYEHKDNMGTIGRLLGADEWEVSQAWQTLSAVESIRKYRWLDYDGVCWCCLRGGGNTATYQKPLIDYDGYAKLAFHAHAMMFQDVVAGSDNVDIVYGPDDEILPVVMNIGKQRRGTLTVAVKSLDGTVVDSRIYSDVMVESGRSTTRLVAWRPTVPEEGCYAVEYSFV